MKQNERVLLYVALRAIDRAGEILKNLNIAIPPDVKILIDAMWHSLEAGDFLDIKNSKKIINRAIIPGESPGYDGVIKNIYLDSLSCLIIYFDEKNPDALKESELTIVDLYDFIAGQRYLYEAKGGVATIFSDDDEKQVHDDPQFKNEMKFIKSDRLAANGISNWEQINLLRTLP